MAEHTTTGYGWFSRAPVQAGPGPVRPPQQYLPFRNAEPNRLQQRKGAPHPLLYTGPRGPEPFRPSTSPTASPDLTSIATVLPRNNPYSHQSPGDGKSSGFSLSTKWPSPLPPLPASAREAERRNMHEDISPGTKPPPELKSSRSISEGMRGLRERLAWQYDGGQQRSPNDSSWEELPPPEAISEEIRASFRSVVTSNSSHMDSAASTERSSMATGYSSTSDFVKVPGSALPMEREESFSVEDAIGLYAAGFETPSKQSIDLSAVERSPERPASSPNDLSPRPPNRNRRSMSVALPQTSSTFTSPQSPLGPSLYPPSKNFEIRASGEIFNAGRQQSTGSVQKRSNAPTGLPVTFPRDRYGFKKASHHITVEQFDAWETPYNEHLRRRKAKWQAMMRQFGLATENPTRFPPKSEKIKRYIRKGIPPEWRGAAWFWYAGGPHLQKKHEGLYFNLLERISRDNELKEVDQEHIERDLNRTFPDNIKFKPEQTSPPSQHSSQAPAPADDGSDGPETPIIGALRRVLQAFAVHRPSIGYCQSLNFIAGLLLLFLDSDEEKAFLLLNVITTEHLPGTHGVSLEGANIDIAVLMTSLRELLPTVWAKLDDKPAQPAPSPLTPSSMTSTASPLSLPTVSLATTPWFLTLYLTTLPVESALRVWDVLFFEGSKTLFRAALAIFKLAEERIRAVSDPMEVFQIVQTYPRSLLDANTLMDSCFRKRGGFGGLSQDTVERRRDELRRRNRQNSSSAGGAAAAVGSNAMSAVPTPGAKRAVTDGMGIKGPADDQAKDGRGGGAGLTGMAAVRGRFRSKTKGAAG